MRRPAPSRARRRCAGSWARRRGGRHKRRFGIDFLYPVERYVNGLTLTAINPDDDTLQGGPTVPNPVFSDLDPTDGITAIRGPDMVFLAGIVGVPWQDLAKDPLDLSKGYKSAAELLQPDASGDTGWDLVLGDPQSYVAPLDPLMVESIDPRTGTNPPTGDALETSANPLGNAINGHEFSNPSRSDLQFSCIFPLVAPKSCANPAEICDCTDTGNDSPLCATDPANANLPTLQVRGKAYPGVRQLSVLKGLAGQGVATSICANQIDTPGAPDFGYRPNVRAIIDAVKPRLVP